MIICFSGTGNSKDVASRLHDILGDEVVMISDERLIHELSDNRVIWVFPIHGWGMPKAVERAIASASIAGAEDAAHYMVCTCGDDIGMADKLWAKAMGRHGWLVAAAYSVQMPNTYVCLPGFDVDSRELETEKLRKMPERVSHITTLISKGSKESDVVRGAMPWIKSYVLRPPFMKYYTSPKLFSVNANCVGCSRCAKGCPMHAITMNDRRPVWDDRCTMCLGCYHRCPYHAIGYGSFTSNKGQYARSNITFKKQRLQMYKRE